jgi:hypothetical protein
MVFPLTRYLLADRTQQVAETKERVNVYSFTFNIGIFFRIINQDIDLMNNYLEGKTGFSPFELASRSAGLCETLITKTFG